jgi:hypothetical protein
MRCCVFNTVQLASHRGVKVNEQTRWSVATLNQFVIEFLSASILLDVAYLRSAIMGRAPVYNGINRVGLYSSKARGSSHPGPAVMRASNHLAVVCLFFGVALAAFLSGSLEQRIGNLFSFGFYLRSVSTQVVMFWVSCWYSASSYVTSAFGMPYI